MQLWSHLLRYAQHKGCPCVCACGIRQSCRVPQNQNPHHSCRPRDAQGERLTHEACNVCSSLPSHPVCSSHWTVQQFEHHHGTRRRNSGAIFNHAYILFILLRLWAQRSTSLTAVWTISRLFLNLRRSGTSDFTLTAALAASSCRSLNAQASHATYLISAYLA